jgi:hypothetical protein
MSAKDGNPKSSWTCLLPTYHGASVAMRRYLDRKTCSFWTGMVKPSKGRRLAPAPDSARSWLFGWVVGSSSTVKKLVILGWPLIHGLPGWHTQPGEKEHSTKIGRAWPPPKQEKRSVRQNRRAALQAAHPSYDELLMSDLEVRCLQPGPSVFSVRLAHLGTLVKGKFTRTCGFHFFADITALTESFDSKLADAANSLVRQLGRHLCRLRADWSPPVIEVNWRVAGQPRLSLKRQQSRRNQ